MFGGHHSEKAVLFMIGHWLDDSGWVSLIAEVGIYSPGKCESLIAGSHVNRTRRAHQLTAACLLVLQRNAYEQYLQNTFRNTEEHSKEFERWKSEMCENSPVFFIGIQYLNLNVCLIY